MSTIDNGSSRPAGGGREGRGDHSPAGAQQNEASSRHLLHYLRVLSKRRWTALGTLGVVVATVWVITARIVPVYQARTQLMIEVERPRVIVFEHDQKTDTPDESRDYQETQRRILRSRSLASRTIEQVGLWQHPEFGGGPPKEPSKLESALDAVGNWLEKLPSHFSKSEGYAGGLVMEGGTDPDKDLGFEEKMDQSRAIDAFLKRLEVKEVGGSRLVDVVFSSSDRKLAAAVANALTDAYIEQNREFKALIAKEGADWLSSQLEDHRKQLRASQDALQRYREQRPNASGGQGADLVLKRLEGLNMALMNARTDRIQKATRNSQVQAVKGDFNALSSLQFVQGDASVQAVRGELAKLQQEDQQLRQKLGERHPARAELSTKIKTTQERLNAEMARVVETVRNDYSAAQEQEDSLIRAVESQKREAQLTTGKQVEYETLARAAATDQQIFETLLQRAKETGVTTGMVASNIRVVDPASVSQSPVSPSLRNNLLMAFGGGSILAVCLAFFAEYMDKGIKTPEQIKAELGLTCLGLVPIVHGRKKDLKPPLLNDGVPAAFQEAFRTVRTSVLFSSQGEPVRTILVTSTGPGDGKTLVASNLAISLAQTGRRVLLLDADMRRPRVHDLFDQPQAPGLSELTAGRATSSQVITKTTVPGLWILPAGSIPPNPAELLSSHQFTRFLSTLSEFFDWVIIDSPPVMAVTDAALIAHVAAGVIFVVGAELTSGPAAMNALVQLDAAQARFLGAVLNKVNFKRNAFYYGDYYKREYGDYYTKSAPVVDGKAAASTTLDLSSPSSVGAPPVMHIESAASWAPLDLSESSLAATKPIAGPTGPAFSRLTR